MGYYSVMLVDDEEDARKSINKKINWEELGFQVIESAENGEEALEKAERLRPDVIMTDIHMPFMDGITFCKRLRSRFIDSKIVIFSGYDDFEYAKEAIKLEVEEYILKPIDSEELYQVFQRVKNRLDDEIYQKKNIERLERYYHESEPFLKEQYFINLLEGRLEASQIVDYQEMYDITIPGDFYSVAIIKADKRKKESIHPSIQSNLVSVSLLQIASEQLEKMFQYTILNYLGEIVVIVYFQREERIGDFIHTMDQVCKLGNRYFGDNITAGVGKVYDKISDLYLSFKQAEMALEYRVLLKANQAIYIKDIEPKLSTNFQSHDLEINQLIRTIKVGSQEDITKEINQIIQRISAENLSLNQLQNFYIEVWSEVIKLTKIYDILLEELEGLNNSFERFLQTIQSLQDIQQWLLNISIQIRGKLKSDRKNTAQLLMDKAKGFIELNYSDSELSVEKMCEYLGLSATYFSTLFKKEMGLSFVAYLTQIRLEHAVVLLNTTDEKAYVISEKVGYIEPNYFSYVFKKHYGVSPSKYRTTQGN